MNRFSLAVLFLNGPRIISVPVYDSVFEQIFQRKADGLLDQNIDKMFPGIVIKPSSNAVYIDGQWIQYALRELSNGQKLLIFIYQHSNSEEIYQFTLDLIDIGVQIYSGDSTLLFLNSASAEMSGIKRREVLGKRLTSIYETDETQSSVLGTLSTHTAVYHKVDNFTVRNGSNVTVLNNAIPFFDRRGNLDAVVNLEYSQQSIERLISTTKIIQKIIPKHEEAVDARYYHFNDIIGHSKCLTDAINLAKMAAAQQSCVFIIGETGTGKELFAQSIYSASCSSKFISINCSTITEGLADAILFGTVKGAFTGSVDSEGLFAAADGGMLFLDEINSLALSTQARLLRVLQEGTYMKVGAVKESRCNVRVLASCNQNPWELMQTGKLREDLFYRLSSSVIKVPPLRERIDDLRELIDYFLSELSRKFPKPVPSVSEEVFSLLSQYNWPGNIRELKNVMEFAINFSLGPRIEINHLPGYIQSRLQYIQVPDPEEDLSFPYAAQQNLTDLVNTYERDLIEQALRRSKYNITKTADSLGLSRQALQYKLRKYHFKLLQS